MTKLQRIIIFILALGIIGMLMFFAFSVFIVAIILAPIAYVVSKFYKPKPKPGVDLKDDDNIIDVNYEVIKKEEVDERN